MATSREEPEVSEVVPIAAKPRLSIVVILAMLLGILLTILSAGSYLHFQQISALQNEVRVVKEALKKKSIAEEEMRAQIEALSSQMHSLKEYSLARSGAEGEKKPENVAPDVVVLDPAPAKDVVVDTKKIVAPAEQAVVTVPAPIPAPVAVKKSKPETQNCDLVGKSVEEQAATLKRCVNLMDSPGEKPRAR